MATTPTPRPSGQGAQDLLSSAGILAPVTGSGGKSQFGLGNLADSMVTVSSLLPVVVDGTLLKPDKDGKYRAEDVAKAFAQASPGVKAQIQVLLAQGNIFYKGDYQPNPGVVNGPDIDAFVGALQTSALTGADLTDYLGRQAKFGTYTGIAQNMTQQQKKPLEKADPLALAGTIDAEFQKITGRKATAGEKAGYIAAYNNAYAHFQQQGQQQAQEVVDPNLGYSTAPVQVADPHPSGGGGMFGIAGAFKTAASAVQNAGADAANLAKMPTAPALPDGTPQSIQDFDPLAFAEQYVHEHASTDSDTHALTGTFSNFLTLLNGIR